jgi:hypothetical protein
MAKTMVLTSKLKKEKEIILENDFFPYTPLYSSSRRMVCEGLKLNHVMNIVIKAVNFIHSSFLNHHVFVALLEETECESGEIIYPSNVT